MAGRLIGTGSAGSGAAAAAARKADVSRHEARRRAQDRYRTLCVRGGRVEREYGF